MLMRIDKFLCSCGICTRSEAKKLLRLSKVTVNGKIIKQGDFKIDTENDEICFKKQRIFYEKFHYLMMNKPDGVVSATKDPKDKTVIDLLDNKYKNIGVFPVGRLDKDTTGLLILTNDGSFAYNTLSPKKHISKKYYVEVDGELSEDLIKEFKTGVIIDSNYKCKEAILEIIDKNSAYVTISEGKYHQIKRMFNAFNLNVTGLERIAFGKITLDENLEYGQYRLLNDDERELIKEYVSKF